MKKSVLVLMFILLPVICSGCDCMDVKEMIEVRNVYKCKCKDEFTFSYEDFFFMGIFHKKVNFEDDDVRKRVINQLAKDGDICKVLGHEWEDSTRWQTIYGVTIKDETRTCKFCDKKQIKSLPDWEDDNRTDEERLEKYFN